MKLFHILIILIILITTGCDAYVKFEGTVLSKQTNKPLKGVSVSVDCNKSTLTDSNGYFNLSYVAMTHPDYDLVLKKQGYLTTASYHSVDTLYLSETSKNDVPYISEDFKDLFNFIIVWIVRLINLGTIVYILAAKTVKRRFIFILLVLFGTISINFSIYNNIFDFEFIKFPFPNEGCLRSWLKIYLPLGAIIFWIYYYKIKKSNA
ncbi:MAG: carboxypeptidase-like regulatory domain-containing protein [Cytophagaceae bacterium]